MTIRLGDTCPDFTAESTEGAIHFHEWMGNSWCIFFSHPKDFTPVCTTELGTVAKMKDEFAKRNCKVIALSVDGIEDHHRWIQDINRTQNTTVNFPIIADPKRDVATKYDMIHPNASDTFTLRSVFIIGSDKKVKLTMTYPASAGRNFAEIIRALDAVQLTAQHSVATPANWQWGDKCVILPSISDEDATTKFPQGFEKITPYLRLTSQPSA